LSPHSQTNDTVTWIHPLLAAAFIAAVLRLDTDGLIPQLLLGAATACVVWIVCRRLRIPAVQVVCCIAVATLGEVILSLGWGLYAYRHATIPFYVPPGHGLMYALAVATARHPALRVHARAITWSVLSIGTVLAAISLGMHGDTWGLVWWIAAVALIAFSRNQLMLSACMTYTVLLEWAGTANGNWLWTANVPFVGLTSANPPSGVGILYVLLDLIVVALAARINVTESHAPRLWLYKSGG
jgi:hypothetical protein